MMYKQPKITFIESLFLELLTGFALETCEVPRLSAHQLDAIVSLHKKYLSKLQEHGLVFAKIDIDEVDDGK